MTQLNLERTLRAQLETLNDIIDRKIVRGQSYSREAKEHKHILTRLSNLKRARSNWMFRTLSLA
ncbi:MAG: hypothetical protein AB198_00395 [Parcubacteria bacterium C7867-003]|nr:MAG: hypothetical protein AB198_00395 [Parcubacteria bacterium C7867-003]